MIANFLLAGQSNIDEWFNANDGAALEAFEAEFLALNPQFTSVVFYDAARGGSAILSSSALATADRRDDPGTDLHNTIASNYWYDAENQSGGPTFDLFDDQITDWVEAGVTFEGIIWAQGEADTIYVRPENAAEYQEGLDFVLTELQQLTETENVYIQALGDRSAYSETLHAGTQTIRQVQMDIANHNPKIQIVTTIFDLDLRDSVHLTAEAYDEAAERMAVAISTGEVSPTLDHAVLTENGDIIIQLNLAEDQRLTENGTVLGFSVTDDGIAVPIQNMIIYPNGVIVLTFETPPANPIVSYGDPDVTIHMTASDYLTAVGALATLPIQPFSTVAPTISGQITATHEGLIIQGTDPSETIDGFSTHDSLLGFQGDDVLNGNDGFDRLYGGADNDTLNGGAGTDRLYGGAGADSFVFGTGYDLNIVYDFDVTQDQIVLDGNNISNLTVHVYNETDLEFRLASGDRIVLRDTALNDVELVQFTVLENGAPSVSNGTDGADVLVGGGQDDLLRGNAGLDRMYGNGGEDVFVFQPLGGLDIVYDYDDGVDQILYENGTFNELEFSVYNGVDVEITSSEGGRLVLRDIDIADITADDFIFVEPDIFAF